MSTSTPVFPVDPFWAPAAWLRGLCEAAISGYQRWLSPHKGYCCAHRVVHKGESCSQYVKRVIAVGGVRQALWLARERFADCRLAKQRLDRRRVREALYQEVALRRAAGLAPLVTFAAPQQRQEEPSLADRVADGFEKAEQTIDGLDVAVDLAEAAPDLLASAGEWLGSAAQGAGDVLSGGVDMLGSACEVLGPAADCAGGCSF